MSTIRTNVILDAAGGNTTTINGGVPTTTPSGEAPGFATRAWVRFNASSGTPVINASGNVTSMTDYAVGEFGLNFTTAMPDTNYVATFAGRNPSGGIFTIQVLYDNASTTASSMRFLVQNTSTFAAADVTHGGVTVLR